MTERVEFMSDGWLQALGEEAQRLLDAGPRDGSAPAFTYVERFTDPPLARADGREQGYRMEVKDGRVWIRAGVDAGETADGVVVMDYAAARSTMRFRSGPELDALTAQAFAAGQVSLAGSLDSMPVDLGALHDALFDRTVTPAA
jgi:hypothetical protein